MYDKEIKICKGLNSGYLYFIDKEHPLAYRYTGLVLYHRHVASMKEGRWLRSDEHVHHLDGNKLNNNSDNLEILSAAEHARLHKNKAETIELVCAGCARTFIKPHWFSEQLYCSTTCSSKSQIKNQCITKELLNDLIPNMSWTALGKMFGYSDNGIKKRAKALGCDLTRSKYKKNRTAME